MSTEEKTILLQIADNLSRKHKHDYTEQRVMGTYWILYELYEQVQDGLDNRPSSISPEINLPLSSNQEQ